LTHVGLIIVFALAVSLVFGWTGRDTTRGRINYGLKIFAEFLGIGLALGWLLYWLPL
jgi:hypothetical protein